MTDLEAVRRVVRARETQKVLGDPENPVTFDPADAEGWDATVIAAIHDAGWAPFHYDRGLDDIREPWRATLLRHSACRAVMSKLDDWTPAEVAVGKLPAMFAACGAAVIVTWLPQFRGLDTPEPDLAKRQSVDDEHIAATAAMVQNLLLLLTAAGLGTYWSSGGAAFRDPSVLARLGVPETERLLALVFVEYPGTGEGPRRVPGKHREARSEAWLREASLPRS